jgi:FKBP-type peptidyl-prolyl cis-trans isomerase FklB
MVTAIFFVAVVSNAQNKSNAKNNNSNKPVNTIQLQTAMDSFSYAAGLNIAENMKSQGISGLNSFFMMMAFEDVLNNKPLLLTAEQANMTLQQKLQEFSKKKSDALKAKGQAFLAENKTKKGVISLPSGLQYEVITAGTPNGMKPTAADTVVVDYVGTLIDGTEFDNSIKRGEPATFPLGGVIRGWTEILQLMTPGAQWKVVIPSELGYGERGAGGSIPPNSTLIFDINLRSIKQAVK